MLTQALDQIEPGEIYHHDRSPRLRQLGRDHDCNGEEAGRCRRSDQWLPSRYTAGTRTELAGFQPGTLCAGRKRSRSGGRLSMSGLRQWYAVDPGDLVFGDLDGVLIVPRAVETEVDAESPRKARGEKVVRKEIEAGVEHKRF